MTTPAVATWAVHPTRPYISNEYLKARPTGLALDALVPNVSDPRQQDETLAKIILNASSEMDQFCYGATGGTMYATTDTEALWMRPDRDGMYKVSPPFLPLLAVTAFAAGTSQAQLQALTDLSTCTVERDKFRLFAYGIFTGTSSAGPLQFGVPANPNYDMWVQYSYVNGWPLTALTSSPAAGANSITVADPTGIYVGTMLTIRDVPNGDDRVTVTSVSGNNIGISTTAYQHSAGAFVDALPEAILDACTEITVGLLKRRAQEGIKPSAKAREALESPGEDNFAVGFEKLRPFVQVRWR